MTFEQITSEIKAGKYKPIYFLHGTESYFIDAISDLIEEKILSESERAFNQTILYGKEIDHLTVVDNARRYPMMSPYQVVIIKEAQEMRSLKQLQSYIEKPMETTILVIAHKHKKLNLNSGFGKLLKANAVVFESKGLYDNQVSDWIMKYLRGKKIKINSDAATLLAEYLGTKLSTVVNELEKLSINLPAGSEITQKLIEENIGISKDYNIFELQKALGQRNVLKVTRIVKYFSANPRKNPLPMVVGSLYNYFSKVYGLHFVKDQPEREILNTLGLRSAFFLKEYRMAARNYNLPKTEQVIALLREYDLKSKGVDFNSVGKPDGDLLKEMLWRIMH